MSNAARRVLELFLQTPKQDVTDVTGVTGPFLMPERPIVTPVTPVTSQKQHAPAGEGVLGVTTAPWSDTEEERAAIIEYDGGAPRSWAEALARLDLKRPPCDMSFKRWLQFIDDCGRFIDEGWAARAEELGWGPLELFGCDRVKPFARIDRAGLLWFLNGGKLVGLTAATATIETPGRARQTYRRSPIEVDAVALAWELAL